jgi:hypothetical protein
MRTRPIKMPSTQARRSGSETGCGESGGAILLFQSAQPRVTFNCFPYDVSHTVTFLDRTKHISRPGGDAKRHWTNAYK